MVRLLGGDIPCQLAVELMTDYLEGALTRRQRRRFERHLAGCPHCRRYLDQLRATAAAARAMPPEDIDPETRAGLIDLYRRYHDG